MHYCIPVKEWIISPWGLIRITVYVLNNADLHSKGKPLYDGVGFTIFVLERVKRISTVATIWWLVIIIGSKIFRAINETLARVLRQFCWIDHKLSVFWYVSLSVCLLRVTIPESSPCAICNIQVTIQRVNRGGSTDNVA